MRPGKICFTRTYHRSQHLYPLLSLEETLHTGKYFYIDHMFQSEMLDATYLAKFHQIKGVIANHGLTLGYLMSVLREWWP